MKKEDKKILKGTFIVFLVIGFIYSIILYIYFQKHILIKSNFFYLPYMVLKENFFDYFYTVLYLILIFDYNYFNTALYLILIIFILWLLYFISRKKQNTFYSKIFLYNFIIWLIIHMLINTIHYWC